MSSKDIFPPDKIDEFYVDCDNEDTPDERFEFNESQFSLIFNTIKDCPKMFKEIKKIVTDEDDKSNYIEKLITKRTIVYIDQNDREIRDEPYILKEKKISFFYFVSQE